MASAFDLVTLSPASRASLNCIVSDKPGLSLIAAGVSGGSSASTAQAPAVVAVVGATGLRIASADGPILGKLILSRYDVDLGYMLTDREFPVTAWNSDYSRALNITGLEQSANQSIIVTGNQGNQGNMRLPPGAAATYTLGVRLVGEYKLDDTPRFVTDELGADSPQVRVTGVRLVVFPLAPDWSAGFDESLTSATSVLTTYSGVEQRAQLMTKPRRDLGFTVTPLDADEAGFLETFTWTWQSRVVAVPEWQLASNLLDSAASGDTVIACDTRFMGLVAGAYVIVHAGSAHFEAARVAAITDSQLSLAFPLGQSYPSAQVAPLSFARMSGDLATSSPSSDTGSLQLSFSVEQ